MLRLRLLPRWPYPLAGFVRSASPGTWHDRCVAEVKSPGKKKKAKKSLRWRRNGHDSVSNHQPHDCLLNRLFRRRSMKTWKLRVTGLCAGNSPGTGEFPARLASYAENVSIWWRHHIIKSRISPIWSVRVNSLWPIDAIWWYLTRSTLAQVMA